MQTDQYSCCSHMSHIMTKPDFAIYEQQRCRSACGLHSLISAFVVRCRDSIIPLFSISKISSLYLASLAAQASLCLTWLQPPKTSFVVTRLIWHKEVLSWLSSHDLCLIWKIQFIPAFAFSFLKPTGKQKKKKIRKEKNSLEICEV